MVVLVLAAVRLVGVAMVPDEVEFATEEGLDRPARLLGEGLGLAPEVEQTKEITMVGDRNGPHPHVAGFGHEPVDPAAAVEHAVVGVHVKVHEVLALGHVRHRSDKVAATEPGGKGEGVRRGRRQPTYEKWQCAGNRVAKYALPIVAGRPRPRHGGGAREPSVVPQRGSRLPGYRPRHPRRP